MTVESASYVADLVSTNPSSTDFIYEGDDHLRLIKAAVKASFPNVSGAVTLTHTAINSALLPTTSGQWTMMRNVTVSGTPSAIDFVNGSNGVVISSDYDQYLIEFTNLKSTSGTGTLRIQISENAGSSFPANASGCSWESDYISSVSTLSRGTGSGFLTLASLAAPSTDPGLSGRIFITRPLSANLNCPVRAELSGGDGASPIMVTTAGTVGSTTNQFDAVRLTLSTSTFAGSNARVRFYGRRV